MEQPHSGLHRLVRHGDAASLAFVPSRGRPNMTRQGNPRGGRCKARSILEHLLFNTGHARRRLRCSSTVPRPPSRAVNVPLHGVTAARAAVVLAASGPWRLVQPNLVDLPDAAWTRQEGERHRATDRQQLGRPDDRHAGGLAGRACVAFASATEAASGAARGRAAVLALPRRAGTLALNPLPAATPSGAREPRGCCSADLP
jgi:hypothetical protein